MPHADILEASLAALVVVDVQEKMLAAIGSRPIDGLLNAIGRLVQTAKLLDVPVFYTEQNPRGLGPTVAPLAPHLAGAKGPIVKTTCSCWRDEAFRVALQESTREHIILTGLETHVCIQQTALDLLRVDYTPFIAADATASRRPLDEETAFARMRQAGVVVSTAESLMFELIERCDHPQFKSFLKIIKD